MIKQKKQLLLSIIFLITAPLLLTSCGFKDIDKRFFVVAMGIDMTENEEKPYRITLKLGMPAMQIDVGKSKTQVETIDTASIPEGIRLLKSHLDKEIDFGQCSVYLLGEELAGQNIREAVEWMSRRRDIQNVAAISIASPTAEEVINMQPALERYPGNMLVLYFSQDATESSYTYVELLSDLARRLNEKGLDPLLPIVSINNDKKTYIIDRVSLLDKEKVVLTLNQDETQLLLQLLSRHQNADMQGSFSSEPYVISINSMKSKYKIVQQEPKPVIDLTIKQTISFEQAPIGAYFEQPEKTVQQIENDYSNKVVQLFKKIQEAGVDPYGFGLRYRINHHTMNFEQEWPNIYESLDYQVKTHIDVRGTGLLK